MDWQQANDEAFEEAMCNGGMGNMLDAFRSEAPCERREMSGSVRLTDTWQTECKWATHSAATLLHLADRLATGAAVIELLQTAPRASGEAEGMTLFKRCEVAACRVARPSDQTALNAALAYFGYLAEMEPCRRQLLEESVEGVLAGMGMGG